MTESELYQREIKPLLKRIGVFYYRVESKRIPDLYIFKNNRVIWAELKVIGKPSNLIKPNWRPGQLAWIKSHGGNIICLILNHCGKTFWLSPKENYKKEELICQKENYLKMLNL